MGKARLFLYSLTKSRWDSSLLPQVLALICHYYLTSGRVLWLFYEHKLTTIFSTSSFKGVWEGHFLSYSDASSLCYFGQVI